MTTSTEIGRFDCAIDGVPFMCWEEPDTAFNARPAIEHQSVRTQRDQSVAQGNIGESTVNPLGFWRRSRDGWHHGAGATYGDRAESDELRFRSSDGVDVFSTPHQATLLHSVASAGVSLASAGYIINTGSRVYLRDNDTVSFTTAPLTVPWSMTTVTGTTSGGLVQNGIASDGTTVFIAQGANGIYTSTTSTSTASSFITGGVDNVWFVKGRLIAVTGASVYNPVTAGALPSALLTLGSGWRWVDATAGPNYIYLLANNDSNGVVYKTAIKPDGTALDVPTVAGELPVGEIGLGIFGYVGQFFIGSSEGVRMASIDANGNLIFGAVIPVADAGVARNAFVGADRFVWFGRRVDGENGLGRMDLTVETLPDTPAYAADLRSASDTAASSVRAIVSWADRRIFVTSNKVFVESSSYVDSGHIDSGLLALDLADAKTPVAFDIEAAYPDDSSITEALSTDRGATFTTIGTFDDGNQNQATITGIAAARQFEIRTTLTASTDNGDTPVLYRHTLKVEPAVDQDKLIQVKLNLYENVTTLTGAKHGQDPEALRVGLEALQASRAPVTFQQGSTNYTVTVRDLDVEFHAKCASTRHAWNSVATATLKVIPS